MSTRTDSGGEDPIIESRDQLIALFEQGEKPPEKLKIGTEHEKFVYARKDHHAPSYPEEGGIRRSEEHTSELQSLMRISYAVFCLKKKNNLIITTKQKYITQIKKPNMTNMTIDTTY